MATFEVVENCYLPHRAQLRFFRVGAIVNLDEDDLEGLDLAGFITPSNGVPKPKPVAATKKAVPKKATHKVVTTTARPLPPLPEHILLTQKETEEDSDADD